MSHIAQKTSIYFVHPIRLLLEYSTNSINFYADFDHVLYGDLHKSCPVLLNFNLAAVQYSVVSMDLLLVAI